MTLEELKNMFGEDNGYFYEAIENRTDIQILEDIDQPASTLRCDGLYIKTPNPVNHQNYVEVM